MVTDVEVFAYLDDAEIIVISWPGHDSATRNGTSESRAGREVEPGRRGGAEVSLGDDAVAEGSILGRISY